MHHSILPLLLATLTAADPSTSHDDEGFAAPDDKWFGYHIAWLSDLDQDGWNDFAVASPDTAGREGEGQGLVFVVSGRDGSLLASARSSAGEVSYGFGLAAIDDLDEDGRRELAIRGIRVAPDGTRTSFVRAVASLTGRELWTADAAPGFTWTCDLRRIGDRNDDGVRDLLVWGLDPDQPYADRERQAYRVLSGKDGSVLLAREMQATNWLRITDIVESVDADGDGARDFVVQTYRDEGAGPSEQRLELVGGASGEVLGAASFDGVRDVSICFVPGSGELVPELLVTVDPGPCEIAGPTTPAQLDAATVLGLDPSDLSLRRRKEPILPDGSEFRIQCIDSLLVPSADSSGTPRRLVVLGSDTPRADVHAVDLADGRRAWTIGERDAEFREWLAADALGGDFGHRLRIDPDPDTSGRRTGWTSDANPWGGFTGNAAVFDPVTGEVRFRRSRKELLDQLGG